MLVYGFNFLKSGFKKGVFESQNGPWVFHFLTRTCEQLYSIKTKYFALAIHAGLRAFSVIYNGFWKIKKKMFIYTVFCINILVSITSSSQKGERIFEGLAASSKSRLLCLFHSSCFHALILWYIDIYKRSSRKEDVLKKWKTPLPPMNILYI